MHLTHETITPRSNDHSTKLAEAEYRIFKGHDAIENGDFRSSVVFAH